MAAVLMPFYTGAVLRSRSRPDDLNPVPAPPDPRARIGAALSGISAELAELPWDWRERTAEERALDEHRPWYWPSRVLTAEDMRDAPLTQLVNTRTGEVVRVEAGAVIATPGPSSELLAWLDDELEPRFDLSRQVHPDA